MVPRDAAALRFLACACLAIGLGVAGCSGAVRGPADAVQDAPAVADEGGAGEAPSNTLRWTTASEVDNFGFDVYRADSEDGPFEKLTDRPIAGAGTADVQTRYKYVDDTIERGREYFYYVESISMGGERKRFTPVIRAPPKP